MASSFPSALKESDVAFRFSTTETSGAMLGKAYMYSRSGSCAARNWPSGLMANAWPAAVRRVFPVENDRTYNCEPEVTRKRLGSGSWLMGGRPWALWARPWASGTPPWADRGTATWAIAPAVSAKLISSLASATDQTLVVRSRLTETSRLLSGVKATPLTLSG